MARTSQYFFLTIGLSLFIFYIAPSNAKGQVVPEILRRMDAHNKALQSLSADVTMVKYDAGLKITDPPTFGNTKYLAKSKLTGNKMYIRLDWTSPDEQISISGDDYVLYRPRIPQVIRGTTKNTKGSPKVGNVLAFMNMSRAELKANYKIAYLGGEQVRDGTRTWHLQLNPITATSYKLAELWVDSDGMPRQAKVTEKNNDTTTILLSNIRKNLKIDTRIFKLKYPDSIRPIDG